jgi:hypothetical protein
VTPSNTSEGENNNDITNRFGDCRGNCPAAMWRKTAEVVVEF